ncbi:MAG: hypothetical protein ABIO45_19405 [Burkholderiaceae bacterium]
MTRSSFFAAAALVLAGVVGALAYPGSASSQASIRTFIPLGVHGSGANGVTSIAWFIDANERKVVWCEHAQGSSNKPACSTTPIP